MKTMAKTVYFYEADDGKQFDNEEECIAYEKEQKEKERDKKEERLRNLGVNLDMIPLTEHTLDPDSWYFRWVKLNNKEDFEFVNSLVANGIMEPEQYPRYICLESESDPFDYLCAEYAETLEASIREAKWFFKQFGYKCEITKKGDDKHNEIV